MRSLFFALLLVLGFAGGAQAQERVRTGVLIPATGAQSRPRPVPGRMVRQVKSHLLASRGGAVPAGSAAAASRGARAALVPRPKAPAPRP